MLPALVKAYRPAVCMPAAVSGRVTGAVGFPNSTALPPPTKVLVVVELGAAMISPLSRYAARQFLIKRSPTPQRIEPRRDLVIVDGVLPHNPDAHPCFGAGSSSGKDNAIGQGQVSHRQGKGVFVQQDVLWRIHSDSGRPDAERRYCRSR